MNSKQTLWILSELFLPEETSTSYIMGSIANAFVSKYDVRVICGPEIYDQNKASFKSEVSIDESIELYRVKGVREDKKSKISRIKKFLLISWRLYKQAKRNIKKDDKVLMVTNPFPLIVLMGYLRRHRDFHLTMYINDVFPDGLFTEMSLPSFTYRILHRLFNKAYASADQLISIGRDMTDLMEKKIANYSQRPSIVVIENWGDEKSITPVDTSLTDTVRIQYAGNIGKAQGVGDFVDVLNKTDNKSLLFNIWGSGSAEDEIKEKVSLLGMEKQVRFNGPYSRKQQQEVLNDSDISLVTLVKGMYGLGVPSKTYNILAAGKPVLYIGEKNTEIWLTVEENKIGYCFEPDDKEGLISFLKTIDLSLLQELKEMGKRARKLVEDKYSKEVILARFLEYV